MGIFDDLSKRRDQLIAESQQKGKKKSPDVAKQKPGVDPKLGERGKKSADHVKKRTKLAQKLRSDGEQVINGWLNNNPKGKEKILKVSPRYVALKEIADIKDRHEVFMMLGLIEKFFGGVDESWRVYNKAKKGNKVNVTQIRKYFTRERCLGKLGFYWGTREVRWDPDHDFSMGTKDHVESCGNWKTKLIYGMPSDIRVWVEGWWAHDVETSKEKTGRPFINDKGKYFKRDVLPLLRKGGWGDEWLGENLAEASKYIPKELYGKRKAPSPDYRDSGITDPEEEEKVLKAVQSLNTGAEIYSSKAKRDIVNWFKGKDNKWVSLDKTILPKMGFLLGENVGNYKYYKKDNRIYFVRIDGAHGITDKNFGGYIDIKDGKLDSKINYQTQAGIKALLKKEVVDKMSAEELKTAKQKTEAETSKTPSREAMLAQTKDNYVRVFNKYKARNKVVKHSQLQAQFYDKYEKALKDDLVKRGKKTEDDATKYAAIRVEEVKKALKAELAKGTVAEAIKENNEVKLKINMDSQGKMSVELDDKNLAKKLKEAGKAALDKGADIKSLAEEQYKAFMDKTGFIGRFADKIFNFKKMIFEYLKTGKKGWALTFAGMLFGAEVSRRALGSRSITGLAQIEALSKKNDGVIKKRLRIKDKLKLKGYKIVIPKGKGISPGDKMKVSLKGIAKPVEADPGKAPKEKPKEATGFIGSIFGGIGSSFRRTARTINMYTDHEITIANNTEIPAKTYIPKGAKIVKV